MISTYPSVYYQNRDKKFQTVDNISCSTFSNDIPSPTSILSPSTVQMYSKLIENLHNIRINSNINSKSIPYISLYRKEDINLSSRVKRSGVIFISRMRDGNIKFLVVRGRTHNVISFPKGRQHINEREEVCASRELYEETGIHIDIDVLERSKRCKIGRNTYFIINVEESDYQTFHIRDHKEILEVGWKTLDELRKMECNKDIRNLLIYPTKIFNYHQAIFQN